MNVSGKSYFSLVQKKRPDDQYSSNSIIVCEEVLMPVVLLRSGVINENERIVTLRKD